MKQRTNLVGILTDAAAKGFSLATRCKVEWLADHLLAKGVLVPPVRIGQKVYTAIKLVEALAAVNLDTPTVSEYEVCGVLYRDGKWYVTDGSCDEFFEVGGELCKFTFEEAEKELKGEENG